MEKRNKTSQSRDKNFWNPQIEKPIIEENIEVKNQVEEKTESIIQPEPKPFKEYNVHVAYSNLRVRREPREDAEVMYFIKNNEIYRILEESNGFGKIADNEWIMLKFTKREG